MTAQQRSRQRVLAVLEAQRAGAELNSRPVVILSPAERFDRMITRIINHKRAGRERAALACKRAAQRIIEQLPA